MNVFILTYRGLEYFNTWFNPSIYSSDVKFHIIDNGQQKVPERLKSYMTYATSKNIGYAGGVNLMCHIAFDHMKLDKIILGQDDGQFTQLMLSQIDSLTTPDTLIGGYDRGFDFALMGLHSQLYNTVGELDENFIYGGCEDNDYKHRMQLAGKSLHSMNYDANLNCSYSSLVEGEALKPSGVYNATYIAMKWGFTYEYINPFNDVTLSPFQLMPFQQGILDVYGDLNEYPSKTEFARYMATV